MSSTPTIRFPVPESMLNKEVEVSYDIPIPQQGKLGGININFAGCKGVLKEILDGAVVIETDEKNADGPFVVVIPQSRIMNIGCRTKKPSSLLA